MNWSELKNQAIKNIFYQDESDGTGYQKKEKQFHLIEYGSIFLELENNSLFEIVTEDQKGGIYISKIDLSFRENLQKNKIEKEEIWSTISDKTIFKITTYKDSFLETLKNKTERKEVISTVEIIFKNGERVFISNAGYIEENKILGLTDDFIIYRNKKIGIELNLIKNND